MNSIAHMLPGESVTWSVTIRNSGGTASRLELTGFSWGRDDWP
jgi:hypothetical protein